VAAYRKFSDTLKSDGFNLPPPKPAKAPKVAASPLDAAPITLGALATLGGGQLKTQNCEPEPDAWTDAHEERAAIVEYDAGTPRAWAEGFARLDPDKPPGDVPARRWLRFINDCGRFLDGGWPAHAAALGWGPLDLFGCDRERPYARLDHQGLPWLVNGGSVVELHRDRAIIETAGGARQSYRRRPVEVGRVVLAWELISCGR
jgi:hypothetical protein